MEPTDDMDKTQLSWFGKAEIFFCGIKGWGDV